MKWKIMTYKKRAYIGSKNQKETRITTRNAERELGVYMTRLKGQSRVIKGETFVKVVMMTTLMENENNF